MTLTPQKALEDATRLSPERAAAVAAQNLKDDDEGWDYKAWSLPHPAAGVAVVFVYDEDGVLVGCL